MDDTHAGGGAADAGGELRPRPIDDRSEPRGSRTPWVAAAVLLVVVALGIGVSVVGSGSDEPASSALPELGLAHSDAEMASAVGMEIAPTTYELVGELPDLGSAATVYRLDGTVTADQVRHWAEVLGFDAPVEDEWGWSASGEGRSLLVEPIDGGPTSVQIMTQVVGGPTSEPYDPSVVATTTTTVSSPAPEGSAPSAPVDVPSDDEAVAIARDLLGRMGVVDEAWSFEAMAGMAATVTCSSPEGEDPGDVGSCVEVESEPQVWSRTVVATATVAGSEVDALFWNVTVGSGGEIESLVGSHATVEALGDYPLQSTRAAFTQLQDGTAIVLGQFASVGMAVEADGASVGAVASGTGSGDDTSVTTTTSVVGSAVDPAPGSEPGVTQEALIGPVPEPYPVEPEPYPVEPVEPEPYVPEPVRISGAHLSLGATTGTVDGVVAGLLVPVYVFEEQGSAGSETLGYEGGVSVVALDPAALDLAGNGTTEPVEPVEPGVEVPGSSGSAGSGSAGVPDGVPDGSDGEEPVTTSGPTGADEPVSAPPEPGAATTSGG